MRQHQLMWEPVLPVGGRPILTRVGADSMLRRVVVDRVDAEDGVYDMLHLGTGEGAEQEGVAVNTPQILQTHTATGDGATDVVRL